MTVKAELKGSREEYVSATLRFLSGTFVGKIFNGEPQCEILTEIKLGALLF
jgi:hypothetical protein